jgi:micrococcal nuclease
MQKSYSVLISLILLLVSAGGVHAWEGVVVRVIDGDSMQIRRDGKIYEIRLYGIDTPEYKQPYSNKAKQFTRRLAYNKTVSVDIDRYGRIVALVFSQGKLVNRELVRAGLAWFYPKYCLEQPLCGELESLERQARKERRGLWRDNSPVSPWDWKRQEKISGSKNRSGKDLHFLNWRRWLNFLGDTVSL